MALDIFLQLPGVDGESKDSAHKGEIDVFAFSWGMSQPGSFHKGGGGGAGKVAVQDIFITKNTDRASTDLLLACCNGRHIPEATLTVRKAGEKPLEYLTIHLEDVIISSYTIGSGGSETPIDSLSLTFNRITVEYREQDAKGGTAGTTMMGWNIKANTKL
jgi:type VI secretion system secreted protein Hcp